MNSRILGVVVLLPALAAADTLTMRNGTRYFGNFNSANATQISFTEFNGNRQTLNLLDVQELRFGSNPQPATAGYGRNSQPYSGAIPAPPLTSPAADLDRLQSDLQAAMQNNHLSDDQRQSLQDSAGILQSASDEARNNRPMNQQAVRLALDSIRNAANTFRQQDRDNLNDDIRRVGAAFLAPQPTGRNY